MVPLGIQMLASSLALLGWLGALLTCILPMWRVTAYVGTTIVTLQTTWEGIWMTCLAQSTGTVLCKPYESTLALGTDLQTSRALMVISLLVASVGLLLAFFGGKCTRFLDSEVKSKRRMLFAAGVALLVAGVLCIIPVTWTAAKVVQNFYDPHVSDSHRRELGAAVYIGWGASILFFLAGGMFLSSTCSQKPPDNNEPSVKYVLVRASVNGSFKHSASSSVKHVLVHSSSRRIPGSSVRSLPEGSQWGRHPVTTVTPTGSLPPSAASNNSKAPSTKSQLLRPMSAQSEVSEGPSTKSQLLRADWSLESVTESEFSETAPFTDEPPMTPTKTYI